MQVSWEANGVGGPIIVARTFASNSPVKGEQDEEDDRKETVDGVSSETSVLSQGPVAEIIFDDKCHLRGGPDPEADGAPEEPRGDLSGFAR